MALNVKEWYQLSPPDSTDLHSLQRYTEDINVILLELSQRLGNVDSLQIEADEEGELTLEKASGQDAQTGTNDTRYMTPLASYAARHYQNVFFPDPSVTDHGTASTNSAAGFVADIGTTEKATIIFRHNGDADTTAYKFKSSLNFALNYTVIIEPGAVLQDDGNVQIRFYGPFHANRIKCFDWDGSSKIYLSRLMSDVGKTTTAYPEWWGAIPDGNITNSVNAINDAIASLTQGGIVELGLGVYHTESAIDMNQYGVTLRGQGAYTAIFEEKRDPDDLDAGTWIWVDATGFDTITMTAAGCNVERLGLAWLQPAEVGGWVPTEYGWGIDIEGNQTAYNIRIDQVFLLNATYGIRLGSQDADNIMTGRVAITNLMGCAFKVGIQLARVVDFSNFDNIHFVHYWPVGSVSTTIEAYLKANFRVIQLYHADQPQFNNIRAFYSYMGFIFEQHTYGNGSGGVQINNVSFDNCKYGIYVNSSAVANGLINNINIYGGSSVTTQITDSVGIFSAAVGADFKVNNISIHNTGLESFKMTAAGGWWFDNVVFNAFNCDNAGVDVTDVAAGTAYFGSQRVFANPEHSASATPSGAGTILLDGEGFGSRTSKTVSISGNETTYQATTAGFVRARIHADDDGDKGTITGYASATQADVDNKVAGAITSYASVHYELTAGNTVSVPYNTIYFEVFNGDYYKVYYTATANTCDTAMWFVDVAHWKHGYN